MELYHLIYAYPELMLELVSLGNVFQVVAVGNVIIQKGSASGEGKCWAHVCTDSAI